MNYLINSVLILLGILGTENGRSELKDEVIFGLACEAAVSQANDPYLWEAANNGGYLFRFSVDINGDNLEEEFLSSSMNFDKTRGDWELFSKNQKLGSINLSGIEFYAIDDGKNTHLPYGYSINATEAIMVDQTISDGRIQVEEMPVHPDQLEKLEEEWEQKGRKIRPKIEAILFLDYAEGKRDWRTVDLTSNEYVFYHDKHFVLKRDVQKLNSTKFSPKDALQALASSGISDDDATQPAQNSLQKYSHPARSSPVALPSSPETKGSLDAVPNDKISIWSWAAGAITLITILFLVRSRISN